MIATLIVTLFFVMFGAVAKILHMDGAESFLIIGLFSSLIFLFVFGIKAINASYLTPREKFMWIFGFLFFGWLAAFLFLLKYRRVISQP